MMKRLTIAATFGALALAAGAQAQSTAEADAVRRFARAYMTYVPGSTYDVRVNSSGTTPAGPYQVYAITRSVADDKNPEALGVIVDEKARTVNAGIVMPVPATNPPVDTSNLPFFVDNVLPQVLKQVFTASVRVSWPGLPARPTAVVPLTLKIGTGYGWATMPLGLTADAKYLVLGSAWSLDRDMREQRREAIDRSLVQWDPGHENAVVDVVEFSDFECPACKRTWSELQIVLAQFGDKVRHGMVNFPLTNNHPWAFRAACAGACVYSRWPDKLLAFKQEMYRLQDSLTVATVDEAALGFLDQQSLDKAEFLACHMRDQVIDRILVQMNLGNRLGVFGTPAYFVNGEHLYGKPDVAAARIQAIINAGGKPENATEAP
jgi:protein-disulfide isomerase